MINREPLRLDVRAFEPRTVPGLFWQSAARAPGRVFLRVLDGDAPVRSITFAEMQDAVRRAARVLREAGVGAGDRVLILSENSPEWQMVALAAQILRAEPAALFASLDAAPVQDIAARVRPKAIFVSTAAQWRKLAPLGLDARVFSAAPLEGATRLADALRDGPPADVDAQIAALGPEDPFLLIFTSGTTGKQKGVRIPQRAMAAAVACGQAATEMTAGDDGLFFLPLAHIAAHDQFTLAMATGHSLIMVARRDDIPRGFALSPTYSLAVPLIWERIWTEVMSKIAASPLRAALRAALDAAARVRVEGSRRPADLALCAAADALVGRKLRQKLGGRMRLVAAGGAPTNPAMHRFYESLGLPYVEAYGMSETCGFIAMCPLRGPRVAGAAGLVASTGEVRLEPDGEICLRGPVMMQGYLEPEPEAYTADGFFRTGDLGVIGSDGLLRVTGRKKHLFVLSTGKKLSPEPIEQAIASGPPITGAVLLGDGKPFVTAALFVEQQVGEEELLRLVRERLTAFSDYEKPKKILAIEGRPQDVAAILTPSMKIKREAFAQWRADEIAKLYDRAR